jgi:hypothetical protein
MSDLMWLIWGRPKYLVRRAVTEWWRRHVLCPLRGHDLTTPGRTPYVVCRRCKDRFTSPEIRRAATEWINSPEMRAWADEARRRGQEMMEQADE